VIDTTIEVVMVLLIHYLVKNAVWTPRGYTNSISVLKLFEPIKTRLGVFLLVYFPKFSPLEIPV